MNTLTLAEAVDDAIQYLTATRNCAELAELYLPKNQPASIVAANLVVLDLKLQRIKEMAK